MKRIFLLLFVLLSACSLQAQDSLSVRKEAEFDKIVFKIPLVTILQGQIPLLFEYRPIESFGLQMSIAHVYLNPLIRTGNILCSGYKLNTGFKIYFKKKEFRERTWFVNPQYFYKGMWIYDRHYIDAVFGAGVSEDADEYDYDESRTVNCIELLIGYIKKYDYIIFEFYFGGGLRSVKSERKITNWIKYKEQLVNSYNYNFLNPPKIFSKSNLTASIQIGVNIGFPIYKSRKAKTVSKP